MFKEIIKTDMARIEVEQRFCNNCSICIKKELQEIENVNNVRLYPEKSLITFNFIKANKLSTALNALTEIGYSEKGEQVSIEESSKSICSC